MPNIDKHFSFLLLWLSQKDIRKLKFGLNEKLNHIDINKKDEELRCDRNNFKNINELLFV